MNDRVEQTGIQLDQYGTSLEREIQRYERLYDLYIDANPDIAIMLAERLDTLCARRRKENKE
jgi:hypothetical protein